MKRKLFWTRESNKASPEVVIERAINDFPGQEDFGAFSVGVWETEIKGG